MTSASSTASATSVVTVDAPAQRPASLQHAPRRARSRAGRPARTRCRAAPPASSERVHTLLPSPTKPSRSLPSRTPRSQHREEVGQRLAGVVRSDSAVDDRDRGVAGELLDGRVREGRARRPRRRTGEVAGEVGDRLALAQADVLAGEEDRAPPSWAIAASKLTRVRSDGFSKTRPSVRPASGVAAASRACVAPLRARPASARSRSSTSRPARQVGDRAGSGFIGLRSGRRTLLDDRDSPRRSRASVDDQRRAASAGSSPVRCS